jgi:hypothetical protein
MIIKTTFFYGDAKINSRKKIKIFNSLFNWGLVKKIEILNEDCVRKGRVIQWVK